MRVSAGQAVKYATLPGIFPRIKGLFFTGFGPVTQLVALICFTVGLLPRNHPCFSRKTKDQYSLVKILATAANNVEFKWKNIDQIIILTAILCGTVMMFLYVFGLIFFVAVSPASALGLLIPDMLVTVAPERDIAFMMMDRTFGLPGVFDSCVSLGTPCYTGDPATNPFPTPFQVAMHELFRFYSMGIFFIALFVFLYHIVNIVFDVTQTGKVTDHLSDGDERADRNFGWLPIRFIVAFGLLLPFGEGLNSAQWIVLYTAKYGSGLATNAWIQYNVETGDTPTGELNETLVAKPSVQDTSGLIKSLLLLRACRDIHGEMGIADSVMDSVNPHGYDVQPYVISGQTSKQLYNGGTGGYLGGTAAGVANGAAGDPFIDALNFSGMGDIKIVFGERRDDDPTLYQNYPGGVLPVCGQVNIPVTARTGEGMFAAEGYLYAVMHLIDWRSVNRGGGSADLFQINVYVADTREFNRTSSMLKFVMQAPYTSQPRECFWDGQAGGNNLDGQYEGYMLDATFLGDCHGAVPSAYWNKLINDYYKPLFAVPPLSAYDFLAGTSTAPAYDGRYAIGGTAWDALGKDNPFLMTTGILEYGWGGAGLWYNKISERNGSLYTASTSLPMVKKYPLVMEQIKEKRVSTDSKTGNDFCGAYNPQKSGTSATYNPGENNQFSAEQATALHTLCTQLFDNENVHFDGITKVSSSSSPVEQAINAIFSEMKSYDIQQNQEVTPMAQLSSIGRMLIDKAVFGFAAAAGSAAAGGMMHSGAAADDPGALAEGLGQMADVFVTFAVLGLTGGVMMHYILPFMPFIYFFFAVGRWVKTIFEAMVGVPLWAFAHMQTGGKGLSGDAASGGYFLILEIFIRPILTVFSLVAAFAIFSAMAVGLNSIFTLVGTNLFGAALPAGQVTGLADILEFSRGITDQFFLSLFYIFIMYTIGTACFKLIDFIPDNIMRWTGAGVSSIGATDNSDDLLYQFEGELPYRIEAMTQEAGGMIKEALYKPGHDKHQAAQAELKQAQALEKAKQAEAAANQKGGE